MIAILAIAVVSASTTPTGRAALDLISFANMAEVVAVFVGIIAAALAIYSSAEEKSARTRETLQERCSFQMLTPTKRDPLKLSRPVKRMTARV